MLNDELLLSAAMVTLVGNLPLVTPGNVATFLGCKPISLISLLLELTLSPFPSTSSAILTPGALLNNSRGRLFCYHAGAFLKIAPVQMALCGQLGMVLTSS